MGANTSDADFLKGLGRGRGRGSSQFYKKSANAAGVTVWQDFYFDAPSSGVTGTLATSQAQTVSVSGTASPQAVSGALVTSQAETIAGSGSFAGAGIVSGDVATSQAQTVISTGQFTVGQSGANQWYGYLTSYELLNKKKKHKQIEIETPEEVLVELPKVAPIDVPDEAKRLLKVIQKKAHREGKAIADAFVSRLIEQAKIRAFEELRVLKQIENQRLEWLAEEDEEDAILLLL